MSRIWDQMQGYNTNYMWCPLALQIDADSVKGARNQKIGLKNNTPPPKHQIDQSEGHMVYGGIKKKMNNVNKNNNIT